MAVRGAQAILGTFQRVGVLCLAGGARSCIAHGLSEAPDTFSITPLVGGASGCVSGVLLESWDAVSVVFVNSYAQLNAYVRIAVEYSQIQ